MLTTKHSRFWFNLSMFNRIDGKKMSKKARFMQACLLALALLVGFSAVNPGYALQVFNAINPGDPVRRNVKSLKSLENSPIALPSMDDANKQLLENQSQAVKPVGERKVVKELVGERKANSKTFLNSDGTKTMELTTDQQHYKEDAKAPWKEIDNTLEQKKAQDGARYFEGEAGAMSSIIKRASQGISVDAEDKKIVIKPMNGKDVQPERVDDQTVIYHNVWPGVDLEYELRGEAVKEIIIVRDKNAPTTYDFKVDGGEVVEHPTRKGELGIKGMSDDYSFSSLTLDVNKRGVINEERVFQKPTKDGINVSFDADWFKGQPKSAFPMRIDPTFTKSGDANFSYKMYRSDGFGCNASNCYINTGSLNDSGWKHWRTYFRFNYDALKNKTILTAKAEGTFKSGINGTSAAKTVYLSHASCSNKYACVGSAAGSASTTTNYNITFTNKLKELVNANNMGAWWGLRGQEGSSLTYKPYSNTKITVTYDTPTPMATATTPANKATVVTTQPKLQVNNVTDADGDAVRYYFRVATNPDAETGAVINSGWIASREWTVPEHILQDGRTYYWHVYTRGNTSVPNTVPNWVRSFKVDMRTGKNSTQAYEEVGPISVDLATGNATTSTGSHNISALSGDIGVSLNYNTPALVQSGVAQKTATKYGLTGYYYNDTAGTRTFPSNLTDPNRLLMKRSDSKLSFNWGTGAPSPGLPTDKFLVRWKGYITVPEDGVYTLGTEADDGVRIKLGTGQNGADETVFDGWNYVAGKRWGTPKSLNKNQPVPITVEYSEVGGSAHFKLNVKGTTDDPAEDDYKEQDIPATWIAPNANILPDGWELGVGDEEVNFERLQVESNTAILSDSTGQKYEYTWTGSGYKAPENQEATLLKNGDNTYTVLDVDGKAYIFNNEGNLISVTIPDDDRQPAALKYEYAGNPSRLVKISDGVNEARNGTLHYAGDNECEVLNGDFHAAPAGYLCAFKTTDGKKTTFQYKNGNLARVVQPGDAYEDFEYDDDFGRITAYRDTLANDAIAYGVRSADASTTTEINYNESGKVTSVKAPAPTVGANRAEETIDYAANATVFRTVGAPEPHGFSRKITYDNTFRILTDTDVANLTTTTEWDAIKDLVLSSTDPKGLKSTTIYDELDRPTDEYGPAPSSWFGSDRKPIASKVSEVARQQTNYDEDMTGLGVAVYGNTKLSGVPKHHLTGFNQNPEPYARLELSNSLVAPSDGLSMRASGKIKLNQVGSHSFRLWHSGGARLFIDGELIADNWEEGNERYTATGSYSNTKANNYVDIVIETFKTGTSGSGVNARTFAVLHQRTPAQTSFTGVDVGKQLAPNYGLQTSTKVFDNQVGDTESKTSYDKPEYAQSSSTTVDPTGLSLTTGATYETPGNGFLRQTEKTLPSGSKTKYEYYDANESRSNPCIANSEAVLQGGFVKKKINPDPDNTGSQAGRVTETVYGSDGKIVAERYNNDAWECISYDDRGREITRVMPGVDGRTVSHDYLVSNNPLKTSVSDSNGTITTEKDLEARVVEYTDTNGKATQLSYGDRGLLASKTSPLGTETFEYNDYDKLTVHKLDGTTYATVTYDGYGRENNITYAHGISLSVARDAQERENSLSYSYSDDQVLSDAVTYSQSGKVIGGTEDGKTKSYTYDSAGRLTGAVISDDEFTYSFGAADTSCSNLDGNNPNAGKSGNRTSQTVNGQSTTFCYDYADRLIGSSDSQYDTVEYDGHGNITKLGSGSKTLNFEYDSSDRNTAISQGDKKVSYKRDANDRIISREVKNGSHVTSLVKYGYSEDDENDPPAYLLDSSDSVVEVYLALPGDVLMTIYPAKTGADAKTVSLPNIHGDVMATLDANGTLLKTHMTGPFGEMLAGKDNPKNTAEGSSYGYVGQHQKSTEHDFSIPVIQMGARAYLPTLGRFMQVDPIEGGVDNSYVYPPQPITGYDLTGELVWFVAWGVIRVGVHFAVRHAAKKGATRLVQNKIKGRIAEKVSYRAAKIRHPLSRVQNQGKAYNTPYGRRYPDLRVTSRFNSKKVRFYEVKYGKSAYKSSQQKKDKFLAKKGYKTKVLRYR